jgi:hypothetical protein
LQLQEHMERPQLKYFGTYFIWERSDVTHIYRRNRREL